MINWILHQQIILSMGLLSLILLEKYALKQLGAKTYYTFWLFIPALLIANNLPQDLLPQGNAILYRYSAILGQQANEIGAQWIWQAFWLAGVLSIIGLAAWSQFTFSLKSTRLSTKRALAQNCILPKYLKLAESAHITSPVLVGIFSPTLVLPQEFQQKFDPIQQHLILQHELVHYRRADNLCNLLALLVVALMWFNPLVWMAYGVFRRSQEIACDAQVLSNKNKGEKIAYSKALLHCAQSVVPPLFTYSQYGAKHNMLKRIDSIKNASTLNRRSLAIALAISTSILGSIAFANQQGEALIDPTKINEASPIVRIEPMYPKAAARDHIEGSVLLQFDIEQDGSTGNIKIIKALPEDTFNQSAITALEKWQYKPQVLGGKAHKQTNLLVQLDFLIDQSSTPRRPLVEGIKVVK